MNAKGRVLRGGMKALFFVLLWVRPLVRWPLRLLSFASLLAFVVTLVVPYPVDIWARVMMAGVGVGALSITWLYDSLLGLLSGDEVLLFGQ